MNPVTISLLLGIVLHRVANGQVTMAATRLVCPDINSTTCLTYEPMRDQCLNDVSCPSIKKCCCTKCGRKCVFPLKVKPGRCPPLTKCQLLFPAPPRCPSDNDCPMSQKCCDSCGKKCADPVPEVQGVCPKSTIIRIGNLECPSVRCNSDEECPPNQMCCSNQEVQECVRPSSDLNAQDICPALTSSYCPTGVSDKCKSDSQCPKGTRCCCSSCGRTCLATRKVKPGRCPPRSPECRNVFMFPKCESDADCPDTQKCCDNCGMACADVLPGPEESCPSYDIKDAGSLQCPFIFCTSDNDCRLDQKCCLSDESQKCVKPQPDVLNVCPPFDPAICPLARPGPDECKTDVQCPRDKKCCCSNCGWKCVPPVQVKYGRCPPILAKCKTPTPVPKCKQDSDCPNKKKCCDICGKSCWDPEEEPFGSCPDAGIAEAKSLRCSSVTCSRDADCAADEKCCASRGKQQCVKSPTEVTTVCPPSKAITCVSGKAQSDDCRSDADCPKSKKCCCSSCGAKCVYPIKRKAGRCPLVQTICAAFPSDPQCDTDTDCPGDKKCCDICGRVCSDPKPEPAEACPAVAEDAVPCTLQSCNNDDDCTEEEKCCTFKNKRQCLQPPRQKTYVAVKEVCPSYHPFSCIHKSPEPDECRKDDECPRSQKCCCSQCKLKCVLSDKVKPGQCPRIFPLCKGFPGEPRCKGDGDCPGEQKCCNICGWSCRTPTPDPVGTCPEVKSPRKLSCRDSFCGQDGDCSVEGKCCRTAMGQDCVYFPPVRPA